VIGYIKGKSAIHLAPVYGERKRNFVGQHLGTRVWVSTVGRDEAVIREHIRKQEEEDKTTGPVESVAINSHRQVAPTCGAALATSPGRFERLTT
jgi:putative transposase